jgi:uroporphyrinogen decarboxylase
MNSAPQQTMTSRQRVLAALSHTQPDRVPIDLGSTIVTGISMIAYNRLKHFLKLDLPDAEYFEESARLATVDQQILDLFGVDTCGVRPGVSDLWIEHQESRQDASVLWDEWGFWRNYSSTTGTYFLDRGPLSGEISLNSILSHSWPIPDDPGRVRGLREQILTLRQNSDRAILLALPSNFILTSFELRGFEDWYIDSKLNKKLLGALLDQILDIQLEICGILLDEVGDLVDIVVNFDDLAMQDRLLVSLPTYQELLEPRLKKLFAFIRSKTDAVILHHTDGAVEPILDSLIEIGVDAVNPLQVSAQGMGDISALKGKYGERLAFWGGIDTQSLLPFGTPEEVKRATIETISILSQSGGYILGSVHNIQNDVPPQNIIALFEAALEHPSAVGI